MRVFADVKDFFSVKETVDSLENVDDSHLDALKN